MALPSIFTQPVAEGIITRINALSPNTQAQWGKMSVAQMLAHCNVPYEMTYENIHPEPNALVKLILKLVAKNGVVNEKPYPKNTSTAPQFLIKTEKDFDTEKNRLIGYIRKTQELGAQAFDQKKSHSFGVMSTTEWNNMFYKHLDHHLTQFGV